jgi:RNA-binding protein
MKHQESSKAEMTPPFSAAQRDALRKSGHHLKPSCTVGHQGLSESVVRQVDQVLAGQELIKVRLRVQDRTEARSLAEALAERTGAQRVQLIGRVALLYRATNKKGD